jgi:hypothetical protein
MMSIDIRVKKMIFDAPRADIQQVRSGLPLDEAGFESSVSCQ